MKLKAYAKESLIVSTSAIGFTEATMKVSVELGTGDKPEQAVFVIERSAIRYWVNGDDPTETTGLIGEVGDIITIIGRHDIEMFRAISKDGNDAVLSTQFFTT